MRCLLERVLSGGLLLCAGTADAQPECAACHPKIAATYSATGMARSFQKADRTAVTAAPFLHQLSDTWYSMVERDGQLLQRRWRVDPDGKQIHLRELSVDYVMGSGNHARSYLHQTPRGALFELPLAWYPEGGGTFLMSPGHDRGYSLPLRSIAYECMFCHNGYPAIPPRHDEPLAEPVYGNPLPQGIDCQRCHGSGTSHIAKAQSGKASAAEVRSAIVNPARLSSERQMDVCMQCHLETTALPLPHSLLQYGRGPFSYRPGEPLGDFMLFFDHAAGSKYEDDFEIAHSAYRLRKSQCFLKSAGRMTCTTCHNPHDIPRGEQATGQYNKVCASCHQTKSWTHPFDSGCIACHMPKRQTQDVIHASMTDHWITRKPAAAGPPLSERAEFDQNQYRGEVRTYYPTALPNTPGNALLTAIAQVTQKSDLARGLPRLAAEMARQRPAHYQPYIELGQAWLAAGKTVNAATAFEEALRRKPDSVIANLSLADVLTQTGRTARAINLLNRAVQSTPDEPLLWYQLGLAHTKSGHDADAVQALAKSVALDPAIAEVHNLMGTLLASRGDSIGAENEFQSALSIHPDFPEALGNLGQLLGLRGRLTDATYFLARATKLKPGAVDVRINYAIALAALGKLDDAQVQIEAALQLDSKLPAAHFVSGSILEKQNQPDKALVQIEAALRLRPDYPAARLAAARLLKAKSDAASAERHLRLAR